MQLSYKKKLEFSKINNNYLCPERWMHNVESLQILLVSENNESKIFSY